MANKSTVKVVERILRWSLYIIFVLYCISLLVPLIWMIFTATKSTIEYESNLFLWPKEFTFKNFAEAYKKIAVQLERGGKMVEFGIWDMLFTSFIWSFSASFLSVVMTTCVAYVLSRYKFFGSNFLYMLGIFIMVTPIIGSTPSMMTVRKALGIYKNMPLTILTQNSTTFSGLNFMILYAAFKNLPKSFSEAAMMDGAGHFHIMFRIMIPLVIPTCAVIFILAFISHWNEYSVFLVWLPNYANLAYGMYKFQNEAASGAGSTAGSDTSVAPITQVMAGFVIACIPSITIYLLSQKLITSNFTVGGLKG